jgi:hypothetical protein
VYGLAYGGWLERFVQSREIHEWRTHRHERAANITSSIAHKQTVRNDQLLAAAERLVALQL